MTRADKYRLTRGYASLSLLERTTKWWLFNSLVTPSPVYASLVWAPGLPPFMWVQLERPLVMMLSRQLQSKSISPDDMSRPEFTLPPMLLEARFQVVVFINRIHSQSQDKISRQAFEASRSL